MDFAFIILLGIVSLCLCIAQVILHDMFYSGFWVGVTLFIPAILGLYDKQTSTILALSCIDVLISTICFLVAFYFIVFAPNGINTPVPWLCIVGIVILMTQATMSLIELKWPDGLEKGEFDFTTGLPFGQTEESMEEEEKPKKNWRLKFSRKHTDSTKDQDKEDSIAKMKMSAAEEKGKRKKMKFHRKKSKDINNIDQMTNAGDVSLKSDVEEEKEENSYAEVKNMSSSNDSDSA